MQTFAKLLFFYASLSARPYGGKSHTQLGFVSYLLEHFIFVLKF